MKSKMAILTIILVLAITGVNCSSRGTSGDRPVAASPSPGPGAGNGPAGVYNINDYLNYAPGNYWSFTSNSGFGEYRYEVGDEKFIHGYDCWPVTLYVGGSTYRMEYPTLGSGDLGWVGLGTVGNDSDIVKRTPATRFGIASMTVGQSWTDSGEQTDSLTGANLTYTATGTLEGIVSVDFDDGTNISQECLKIRHENNVGGTLTTITRYYAPGSGMVRYEEDSLTLTLTDSNALR